MKNKKCYETWPSDTAESVRQHIQMLEKRVIELEKEEQTNDWQRLKSLRQLR